MKDERIHKIFVGGMSQKTKEDAIYDYFSTFGPIYKAYLIYDHNTGQSRCFGFVEFNDRYSLDLALSIKTHIIDGRDVECKFVYLKSELDELTSSVGKKSKRVNKKRKDNNLASPQGKSLSDTVNDHPNYNKKLMSPKTISNDQKTSFKKMMNLNEEKLDVFPNVVPQINRSSFNELSHKNQLADTFQESSDFEIYFNKN